MKPLKDFKIVNEEYEEEMQSQLASGFVFEIKPTSVEVEQADDEYMIWFIVLSNGDKLEYDSFKTTSPNPADMKKNYTTFKVNGKNIKLSKSEDEEGYYGAIAAYKRTKKL